MLFCSVTILSAALMTAQAAAAQTSHGGPVRQITITFDDLPGVGTTRLRGLQIMNRHILTALRKAGAPAIGFVNESVLHVEAERDSRVAILQSWLDAGMAPGNHTFQHKGLTATPLDEFEDDVMRGEVITRTLLERRRQPLVYFRYPYSQTGKTAEVKKAFETFLATRGYKIAPFTIENSDWAFADLYADALARRDRPHQRAIKARYLQHLDEVCTFFEG